MDEAKFKRELKTRQIKVDEFIWNVTQVIKFETFRSAATHLIEGGKRMRPALALFACGASGGHEDTCIPVASAIEILNTYTLIHDDIIDKDEKRRNVPTVHVKFGIPTALLAGDALHSIVILTLSSIKPSQLEYGTLLDIISLLEVTSLRISEGQFCDSSLQTGQITPNEENYIKMAEYKTAYLFQTAAEAGSLVGCGDKRISSIFREYGHAIGIGFQIQDDILGITADESVLGKPVGSDIREGKMSLPVIHFLDNASSSQRSKFMEIFGKNVSLKEIELVRDLFKVVGSLDYAKSRAKFYAGIARAQLGKLNLDSYYRDLLETFVVFSIEREY